MTAALSLPDLRPRAYRAGDACAMKIMEVELCQPLPAVSFDGKYQRLFVLVRLQGEPIGTCTVDLESRDLAPERLGGILWREFGDVIAERFAAAPGPRLSAAPHRA